MFSLFQLNTAILDRGTPGLSLLDTALLLLLIFAVPMVPYVWFYWSLREKRAGAPQVTGVHHGPFTKMTAWMHAHHPQPLHH